MAEYFTIRCSDCRRRIRIYSVSLFRHDSYSYGYTCPCGCAVEVDGHSADGIPEPLKEEAQQRYIASRVQTQVDYERRDLPSSETKQILRDSRPQLPAAQADGTWLVYGIARVGEVFYDPEDSSYKLVGAGREVACFTDVSELVGHLERD